MTAGREAFEPGVEAHGVPDAAKHQPGQHAAGPARAEPMKKVMTMTRSTSTPHHSRRFAVQGHSAHGAAQARAADEVGQPRHHQDRGANDQRPHD